ncbi:MAG TPA: glycosyltransferase family 4 protein [Fibrobacteria bacterium]|nr:glycosyltransferase family 4 protein [Fibrobacteria bacterium]
MTIQRAERAYVSNKLQTAFLGGAFFPSLGPRTNTFIDSLPQRIVEFPMGVSEAPFPDVAQNPYPPALQGRPIFLWGGGIWSWFDVPTLLQAMKILADQGSDAVLFFLGGKTLTGRIEHERPIQEALALSEHLGLLDRSVFFNERRASVSELPGFLSHSLAGVMANPSSFESLASWRTRYLDLLWAGKPLIASGSDPLGLRMADSGAARLVNAGDPSAFADAMAGLVADPDSQASMGAASQRLGRTMSWSNVARPLLEAVEDPTAFRNIPHKPSSSWMIRYRLGV